jgi:hypothetical protein
MKCSECESISQFVCFCQNKKFLCLTHFYYHSELCKKPKKTSESYYSYRNSLKSSLTESKKQVSIYTKSCIQQIQKALSLVFKQFDDLIKFFQKSETLETKSFSDHLKKIESNYFIYTQKISKIFETFSSFSIQKSSKHLKTMSQKIDNLSELLLGMEIDELPETCQICQARLSLSTMRKVNCGAGCSLCFDCRLLDKVQCISCFRYYSTSEMIFPH